MLVSCSTSLSDAGRKVIIVQSHEVVKDMEMLGIVEGSSSVTGARIRSGRVYAMNDALNKAAKLGATHFHVQQHSGHYMSWSVGVRGIAYRDKK